MKKRRPSDTNEYMKEQFADILFLWTALGVSMSKGGQLWQVAMVAELQHHIAGNGRTAALPAVFAKDFFPAVPSDLAESIIGIDQRMVW